MTEIGKAYGGALFQLAREEVLDETIGAQLSLLCGALREDPDYVRLMMTPTLKKSKRLEILQEGLEGKFHEYLMNFLSILVENGTFEEVFSCNEEYRKLYNKAHNIVTVTAYTVIEMDDVLCAKLREKLEAWPEQAKMCKGTIEEWVLQNAKDCRYIYDDITPGCKIDRQYLLDNQKLSKQQCLRASYRLAHILNESFK